MVVYLMIHFEKDNFAEDYKDLILADKKIEDIEFESCSFEKCNFNRVSFKNCIFSECTFKHCDLSLISVLGSQFSGIVFADCKIIGIDWTKALWASLTIMPNKFYRSVLNDSSFWELSLEKVEFIECELKDTDFREAKLKGANFSYSDLSDALFRNSDLSSSNFSHCKNYDIDINQNIIKDAKFSRYDAVRLLNGIGIKLID